LVDSHPEDRFVAGVRFRALRLLAEIGSEHDTAAVIPLLSDTDSLIRYTASETLAKIGGRRDLEAMDAWLKNGKNPRPKDTDYPLHVKKCRDELEKRLKDNPIPKDIIN
jgi:HEAT repeat protein